MDPDFVFGFLDGGGQNGIKSLAFQNDLYDLQQIPVIIQQQYLSICVHGLCLTPLFKYPSKKLRKS